MLFVHAQPSLEGIASTRQLRRSEGPNHAQWRHGGNRLGRTGRQQALPVCGKEGEEKLQR